MKLTKSGKPDKRSGPKPEIGERIRKLWQDRQGKSDPHIRIESKLEIALKLTVKALKDAQDHLEYCGYGDRWERECAQDSKLPDRIESALAAGRQALGKKETRAGLTRRAPEHTNT